MAAKGALKQSLAVLAFLTLCMALIAEWAGLRQGLQDNLMAYLSKRQDVAIAASPHPRGNGHRMVAGVEGTRIQQRPQQGSQLLFLKGSDFRGGTGRVTGYSMFDKKNVNAVCARSTGPGSEMRAAFDLTRVPQDETFLYLLARHDYFADCADLQIALNGADVLHGPSRFAYKTWQWTRLAIPSGALRAGRNELVVSNLAERGNVNDLPVFVVAELYLGDRGFAPPGYIVPVPAPRPPEPAAPPKVPEPAAPPPWAPIKDFYVELPADLRPFPEPLPPGKTEPGFKLRGIKGWCWSPEQYLAEIPFLAKCKMNFLMNCYGSMYESRGGPNEWWKPLKPEKKAAYERVVKACQDNRIQFCFSMHPCASSQPLKYESDEDFENLWQHYAWMEGLGVKWFSICLDDISHGVDAKGQARLVRTMLERLRQKDPEAQLIFCPTEYNGFGGSPYLKTLAEELPKDVYIFWTGPFVFSGDISAEAAQSYKKYIQHRLIIWDNYPVNDGNAYLNLGPVAGRDPALCEIVDGYMSNPLHPQNDLNRIPMYTIADFTYNPWGYDPRRSIGQAIAHLADTPIQREVLKDLVELYPGYLLQGDKGYLTGLPVSKFTRLLGQPASRQEAVSLLLLTENVLSRLEREFPDRYETTRVVLRHHIATMKAAYELGRKPPPPPTPKEP